MLRRLQAKLHQYWTGFRPSSVAAEGRNTPFLPPLAASRSACTSSNPSANSSPPTNASRIGFNPLINQLMRAVSETIQHILGVDWENANRCRLRGQWTVKSRDEWLPYWTYWTLLQGIL